MELRSVFNDERAVSPVIGIILMVAITVILAAVIGTFVLGMGDIVSEPAPTAVYDWDQNGTSDGNITVSIRHTSGDTLSNDPISFNFDSDNPATQNHSGQWAGNDDNITAGDSITFHGNQTAGADDAFSTGDTIQVIWSSSEEPASSVLTDYKVE